MDVVDPETLLFTQDSIRNRFKAPRENERIDDAVEAILAGKLKASDFPALTVVRHDGHLWSLDNRRLWVFKKARVPWVRVHLRSTCSNPRFTDLITRNQTLMKEILEPGYWPLVRGYCRSSFDPPVQHLYSYPPVDPTPLLRSTSQGDPTRKDNSKYGFILPDLDIPRLVGPRSTVKDPNAREHQLTTAAKTSEGWKSEDSYVGGIQMQMSVAEADVGPTRNSNGKYWRGVLELGAKKFMKILTKYVKIVEQFAVMIVTAAVSFTKCAWRNFICS
ncbi:hypothetical protein R1sor_005224 [Riccia sorocarpa]|uniref:Uncharacterized protein n=1 Tax=Riccia sorocarpa TaxID=122646 RepID=A0ABD3HJJ9_9MARC